MTAYPSGAPMPEYGPSTDAEFISEGLEWAVAMLEHRDAMNAAVHCGPTRWSPVTLKARTALMMWKRRLISEQTGVPVDALDAQALRDFREGLAPTAVNWSGDLSLLTDAELTARIDALARCIADNVSVRGGRIKTLADLNEAAAVDKYGAACGERLRRITGEVTR